MRYTVAVANAGSGVYPAAPFDPPNSVYSAVEEALGLLGLDSTRHGQPDWNPLGFIPRGARVLLKPNLVRHFHPYGHTTDSIYTHASVIRAACDYVLRALDGTGEVIIADAPLQTCDFDAVCRLSGVSSLMEHYRRVGQPVSLRDLRLIRSVPESRGWTGQVLVKHANNGDSSGYTTVRLDGESLHAERDAQEKSDGRYRVTCYDPAAMQLHHGGGRHQYVIANTLLGADVVINLPKVKTHQKAGITGALKNFVGINGHKDCLPHHRQGAVGEGGDEYAAPSRTKRLDSWMQDFKETHGNLAVRKGVAVAHRLLHPLHMSDSSNSYWAGSWYGNDTISRTTIDLNRIVHFGRRDGTLAESPQRRVFTIADAIIAGEGDGPLAPTPKAAGLIVAGENGVAVDMILARLMGYRWDAIPTLRHAVGCTGAHPLWDDGGTVRCRSNDPKWDGMEPGSDGESLAFEAHRGWRAHIELGAATLEELSAK